MKGKPTCSLEEWKDYLEEGEYNRSKSIFLARMLFDDAERPYVENNLITDGSVEDLANRSFDYFHDLLQHQSNGKIANDVMDDILPLLSTDNQVRILEGLLEEDRIKNMAVGVLADLYELKVTTKDSRVLNLSEQLIERATPHFEETAHPAGLEYTYDVIEKIKTRANKNSEDK